MSDLKRRVQVCVPFTMIHEDLLDHFIRHALNPEIGIDAGAIERYPPREFADVAAALSRHGLTVTLHAPFVDLSAGSTDPAIRAVTRRRFEELMEVHRPDDNWTSLECLERLWPWGPENQTAP